MWLIVKELVVTALYTLLLAGAGLAVLWMLPRSISTSYSWSALKPLAVLAVCLVVCLYEGFCFVGALRFCRRIAQVEERIAAVDPESLVAGRLPAVDALAAEYPVVARAMERIADAGSAVSDPLRAAEARTAELRRSVRGYAWRRFAWLVGLLFAGGLVLAQDASRQQRRRAAAMRMLADME